MTRKGALALGIATPLALSFGFFLPDLACRVQDASGDEEIPFETSLARLDVAADEGPGNALRVLAQGAPTIDLEQEDEEGRGRALEAALESLAFFQERGFDAFDPARFSERSAKPRIAVDAEEGSAARLWEVVLAGEGSDGWVVALIDDASGKAVQFTATLAEPGEGAHTDAAAWAEAWAEYLEAEGVLRTSELADGSAVAQDEGVAIALSGTGSSALMELRREGVDLRVICEVHDEDATYLMHSAPVRER